jgi:hypothetical protein
VHHLPLHGLKIFRWGTLAWQDSLHIHVQKADHLQINSVFHTKKVHSYNTCSTIQEIVSYLLGYGGYEFFAAPHLDWGAAPLPWINSTCFSFPGFVIYVSAVPNLWVGLIQSY